LDLNDKKMIGTFAAAEAEVTRTQISAWLKKEDDQDYQSCSDFMFATFLNGLINLKRGKKEGPQPQAEEKLDNNIVLRKLKIAFNLQAEDIIALLMLAGFKMSKHELSAFFRRPNSRHYRACKDQILRNFLLGLQLKTRHADPAETLKQRGCDTLVQSNSPWGRTKT
jgi:uncharacterized protein YehS (DUF1456 family)